MKRLKENSDVPEARLGTIPKPKNKVKKTTKFTILLARGRMGYASRIHQKNWRKESFFGGFRSKHAHGQQARPCAAFVGVLFTLLLTSRRTQIAISA